jgi:hypothetical protein
VLPIGPYQNHTPPPPAEPVSTLTPSLDMVHISSPEPEALPTPPWFLDDLYEDLPPNPPNSPIHFPTKILRPTTIFNPQYLDIWFMSRKPSQPPYDASSIITHPLNKTVGTNEVTLWTLHLYIVHFSKLPDSFSRAPSVLFSIRLQPQDQDPITYTIPFPGPLSILIPQGHFSHLTLRYACLHSHIIE